MSDGNLNIQFFANATSLLQAMDKAIRKTQEQTDNLEKMAKTSKRGMTDTEKATAAAAKEMQRFAKATTDINKTPLERYREEMIRLDSAFKAGSISQVTFNRASERAKVALDATRVSLTETKEVAKQAFGSAQMNSLMQYAAGMFSITAAVGVLKDAMNLMKQETDGALASVNGLTKARMGLNQVGTSAQDIAGRNEFADNLAMQYGVSRDAARELVMSARSEGFEGTESNIARLHAANIVDPKAAITAAGMVRGNLGKDRVSPMQAVVGTLIGGEVSRSTVEQYASELPKLSGAVGGLGASPAETMATVAILATENERAAEYTATFANQLGIMKEFKGKGLSGAVDILQAMPEAKRQKVLGTSKEMNMAYGWLVKDMSAIKAAEAQISAGMANPEQYIAKKEQDALFADTFDARLRRSQLKNMQTKNVQEVSRERRNAVDELDSDTAMVGELTRMEEGGYNPLRRWMRYKAMEAGRSVRAPGQSIPLAGAAGEMAATTAMSISSGPLGFAQNIAAKAGEEVVSRIFSRLGDATEKLDAAADNLERATDNSGRQRAAAGITPE